MRFPPSTITGIKLGGHFRGNRRNASAIQSKYIVLDFDKYKTLASIVSMIAPRFPPSPIIWSSSMTISFISSSRSLSIKELTCSKTRLKVWARLVKSFPSFVKPKVLRVKVFEGNLQKNLVDFHQINYEKSNFTSFFLFFYIDMSFYLPKNLLFLWCTHKGRFSSFAFSAETFLCPQRIPL